MTPIAIESTERKNEGSASIYIIPFGKRVVCTLANI